MDQRLFMVKMEKNRKNHYQHRKIVERSDNQPQKIKSSTRAKVERIVETILKDMLSIHPKKKLFIRPGSDFGTCRHEPNKRLRFLAKGTPYSQRIKFPKNCFFEGEIRYSLKRKTKLDLKTKNFDGFDRLQGFFRIKKAKII